MSDFIRQLRHQEKLHRKSGANGLADLFMNAAKELGQQQIDKSVLEQELETTNRHLRLANRKVTQQQNEVSSLKEEVKLSTKEALLMVQAMHKDFYSDSDGAELFEPLGIASGLLTQIDNMYAGIRNDYRELESELRSHKQCIDSMQKERDELAAHIERYNKAALDAIPMLSGGEVKANLRDVYDESPQACLDEHDVEVAEAAIKTALRNMGAPNLTETSIAIHANDYAQQIRNNHEET